MPTTKPLDPLVRTAPVEIPPQSDSRNFRPAINNRDATLATQVQLALLATEELTKKFVPGRISGGAVTIGTGLSVNIAQGVAVVSHWLDFDAQARTLPPSVAALGVYIWLRDDRGFSYTSGVGAATPPVGTPASEGGGGDGRGGALLWARATTNATDVTAVDESMRVQFMTAFLVNSMITARTITEDRLAFDPLTAAEAAAGYQTLDLPIVVIDNASPANTAISTTNQLIQYIGSAAKSATLPAVAGNSGEWWDVKNAGTGVLTLLGPAATTIEGIDATVGIGIYPGQTLNVYCDGTNFYVR